MPELHLYNTLTRSKEMFLPIEPGKVRIYSCGPTVYNFVHIGNLRTFLWSDLLRRYLQWKGYQVTQVMNFTDVDDRIIRHAGEKGVDIRSFCAPYVEAFYRDIDLLRIRRADIYPRATEHIEEMITLVGELTAKGHTYVSDGSTYFDISTLAGYGKLSRIEVLAEAGYSRLERDEDDKQDARDFVLWKAKKEGEPSWSASIGEGRPGWHLECSAMSMKYFGPSFDIHTGAVDLIFPHHENEIAQSEGATGQPFVRFWVHGEHLVVEDRKMSKSAGNFFTLPDLIAEGVDPLHIRYALLAVPHRTRLNFTMRSIDDARSAVERLELFVLRLEELSRSHAHDAHESDGKATELIGRFLTDFEAAMDDDLNTAGALGALFTLVRDGNTAMDRRGISASDAEGILDAIRKVDPVLDILPHRETSLDSEIESMIKARNDARARRDFAESDRVRDALLERGVILEDTPGGTRWRRR